MKQLLFATLCILLLASCNPNEEKEKNWIYQNLETKVWEQITVDAVNKEFVQISESIAEMTNKSLHSYEKTARFFLLDSRNNSDPFTDYFNQALLASAKKEMADYQEHYKTAIDALISATQKALPYRDSLNVEIHNYTNKYIFDHLIGTIIKPSENYEEAVDAIGKDIVIRATRGIPHPKIASCEYDRKGKMWIVRMDDAETQYVKFFWKDNGDADIEWKTNPNDWGDVSKKSSSSSNSKKSDTSTSNLPMKPGKFPYIYIDAKSINKSITEEKELTIYGKKYTFSIGPDHPNGTKIVVYANNYAQHVSPSEPNAPTSGIYDDGGNINDGCAIQLIIGDIDKDRFTEVILIEDNQGIASVANIYRLKPNPYKDDILKYIGSIEGQSMYDILDNGHIISGYGSQGLFEEYEITEYDTLAKII